MSSAEDFRRQHEVLSARAAALARAPTAAGAGVLDDRAGAHMSEPARVQTLQADGRAASEISFVDPTTGRLAVAVALAPHDEAADVAELHAAASELHELFRDTAALTAEQGALLDAAETHVHSAAASADAAVQHVGIAARLFGYSLPVLGAVGGFAAGGPVGMAAGAKAGTTLALSVGGMGLGFVLGRKAARSLASRAVKEQ